MLASRVVTPTIHAIRFARPPGFAFRPVQFCGVELATDEGGIEYPMSLASSPTRDHLEFGARISASPWKRAFAALRPGDEAEVDGPYGHFVLDERRPAVLVAGGIGISPLKGMMEYATDRGLPIRIAFVYSNRTPAEIAFRAELDALAATNPRLRILHTVTRPAVGDGWRGRTGRIDASLLRDATGDLEEPAFYLCGKPAMVAGVRDQLRELGVPGRRILYEEFWGYE